MAVFTAGDKVITRVVCYTDTQLGINRTFGQVTNVVGAGVSAAAVAAAISANVQADYKDAMSSVAKFRGVGLRNLTTLAVEGTAIADDGFGASVFPILPTQVRGLIAYGTSFIGARGRGRHYIPFPSSDLQTNSGGPTNAYVAILNRIGSNWSAPLTVTVGASTVTIEWGLAVWTTPSHQLPTFIRPFNSRAARQKFATQRRSGQYGRVNTLPF